MSPYQTALRQYQAVGAHSQVNDADPHRLVQLVLEAALERVALARGQIQRGLRPQKAESLSRALALVDTLNAAVDLERGGVIGQNLRALYDFVSRRLVEANLRDDLAALDEVAGVLRELKTGWDGIGHLSVGASSAGTPLSPPAGAVMGATTSGSSGMAP